MRKPPILYRALESVLDYEQHQYVSLKLAPEFSLTGIISKIIGSSLPLEDKLARLLANRFLPASAKALWAKKLIHSGADVSTRNHVVVRWASEHGELDLLKLCVSKGGDIHSLNDESLVRAVLNGHREVVHYLLKQGADFQVREEVALRIASGLGHSDLVAEFLTLGAEVTAKHNEALRKAFDGNHLATIKILLHQKATEILNLAHQEEDWQIFAISWQFALKQNDHAVLDKLKTYDYRPRQEQATVICANKFESSIFSRSL